jgi:hypothetical protein
MQRITSQATSLHRNAAKVDLLKFGESRLSLVNHAMLLARVLMASNFDNTRREYSTDQADFECAVEGGTSFLGKVPIGLSAAIHPLWSAATERKKERKKERRPFVPAS